MSPRPQVKRRRGSPARSIAYKVFYRLPKVVRHRVVRLSTPTYTVGSVILLYNLDRTEILLLRQPPGHGWSLPAGLVERREQPDKTALRELHEETGIKLTTNDISPATPNAVVHTNGRWVDCVFSATVDPDKAQLIVDGAEVMDAKWCPVDALPPVTVAASRLMAHYGLGPYADYPLSARIDLRLHRPFGAEALQQRLSSKGPYRSAAKEFTVITAIVLIDCATDAIPEVAQSIAALPAVSEVYSTAGHVDLIAIVRVREFDEIADAIAGGISKVDGVADTETHIAFRAYSKHDLEETFAIGLPD